MTPFNKEVKLSNFVESKLISFEKKSSKEKSSLFQE